MCPVTHGFNTRSMFATSIVASEKLNFGLLLTRT